MPSNFDPSTVDLTRPLKLESTGSGGSQDNYLPNELEPAEDGVVARAFFVQRPGVSVTDRQVYTARDDADNLVFGDVYHGPVTLSDLLATSGGVFGTDFHQQSQGTAWLNVWGTVWTTVLTLTFTAQGGLYRLAVSYEWRYSSAARDFQGRVRVDGTTVMFHRAEPKDPGNDQSYLASACWYQQFAQGQTPQIRLQIRASKWLDRASVRRAVLEVWRVSL